MNEKSDICVPIYNYKKCNFANCVVVPKFNYDGESKGIYCSKHRKDDMVDVINIRCFEKDCKITRPAFNYKNEKKGLYCFTHQKKDMINVLEKRLCLKCDKRAKYNLKDKKPLYCFDHKTDEMFDNSCKIDFCKELNCTKAAYYNVLGELKPI